MRRQLAALALSQVFGGIGIAVGLAVSPLIAANLSGSVAVGGLAQTCIVVGAALLALPVARMSGRYGRRTALAFGYGCGAGGAVLALAAVALDSAALLLAGLILYGGAVASALAARFAATDGSAPGRAARDLSIVVWALAVGSLAGPNLAARLGHGGAYALAATMFGLAVLCVLLGLGAAPVRPAAPSDMKCAWRLVPAVRLPIACIAAANTVMIGLMAMTPVHLGHGGPGLDAIGVVVSLHLAGMYAFSPLIGWLVGRVGAVPVLRLGLLQLLVGAVVVGVAGPHAVALFAIGLTLVGTGWSFELVAGSALVASGVDVASRPAVQGISDLVMNTGGALGGLVAGLVVMTTSYTVLAGAAVMLVCLVGLSGIGRSQVRRREWRPVPGVGATGRDDPLPTTETP